MTLLTVGACGRLGFDTPGERGVDGGGGTDGGGGGGGADASGTGGADAAPRPVDAPASACAGPTPVTAGVRLLASTCGGADRIDGCGPPSTEELVVVYTPAASGSYTAGAYDPGTGNVSNSTGVYDAACASTGTCAGLVGRSASAGVPVYFVLEAASGGCATVEFLVTAT